jgi:hypothetical protein
MLPDVFDDILEEIGTGESVNKILQERDINPRVFWGYVGMSAEATNRYAHARARGLDRVAEDAMTIADDESLPADSRRIRVDSRKWFLAKLAPKKYGDLLHLQHSGSIDLATELESARKRRASDDSESGRTQPPTAKSADK